nr:immunoglobulin heavy chain junction region [Mus musculus]MBK4196124.1 immunoglobulin heavy chain junction region [Mus musculus]
CARWDYYGSAISEYFDVW